MTNIRLPSGNGGRNAASGRRRVFFRCKAPEKRILFYFRRPAETLRGLICSLSPETLSLDFSLFGNSINYDFNSKEFAV